MKIIDFHAHIYPNKIASRAVEGVSRFYDTEIAGNGTVEDLLIQSNGYNVEHYIVHSVASIPKQVENINNFIAQQCEINKKFVGFGTLHPMMDDVEKEINRIKELGLVGIKLHPDFQEFDVDSSEAKIIYEIIEGNMPLLLHCGDYRYQYSRPEKLANVLRDFKDLEVIGAHFGGWSLWEDAVNFLKPFNCYVDTSSTFGFAGIKKVKELINDFGQERVLFGTDYPMWNLNYEINNMKKLELPQDIFENIIYNNAKKLLTKYI